MATDSKPSVSSNAASAPGPLPAEVEQALACGLGNYTLRELLSWMLSSVGVAERRAYLEGRGEDKANGFYDRALQVGSLPVEIRVARTRTGDFRPASLPAAYERGYRRKSRTCSWACCRPADPLTLPKTLSRKWGFLAPSRIWRRWPVT